MNTHFKGPFVPCLGYFFLPVFLSLLDAEVVPLKFSTAFLYLFLLTSGVKLIYRNYRFVECL